MISLKTHPAIHKYGKSAELRKGVGSVRRLHPLDPLVCIRTNMLKNTIRVILKRATDSLDKPTSERHLFSPRPG